MDIGRITSWRWVLAGLVAGAAGAGVWAYVVRTAAWDYGETVNGTRDFERALIGGTGRDGMPHGFTDLTVYPARVAGDGGRERAVHVVSGLYTARRRDSGRGRVVAEPERRCYVAAVPYRPAEPGAPEYASVTQYLDSLRGRGVTYRYAWWRDGRSATVAWVLGGLLGVGVVCPAVRNLRRYGTIVRPADEDATGAPGSTAGAEATTSSAQPPADMADVDAMIESVSAGMGPPTPVTEVVTAPASKPAAVPRLTGGPAAATKAAAAGPGKQYGARDDDYYPTEREGKSRGAR